MNGWQFPQEWTIEICTRCGSTTEYDRDYGGPFPTEKCPFDDCDVNKDRLYGTCPCTRSVTVQKADSTATETVPTSDRDPRLKSEWAEGEK